MNNKKCRLEFKIMKCEKVKHVVHIFHFFVAVPLLEHVITYPETIAHRRSQVQNFVKFTKKTCNVLESFFWKVAAEAFISGHFLVKLFKIFRAISFFVIFCEKFFSLWDVYIPLRDVISS